MTTDPKANTGKPIPPALPGVKPAKPVAAKTTAVATPVAQAKPVVTDVKTKPVTATTATTTTGTKTDDSNYDIPDGVKEKYPDLIELILSTKSMNEKEKQYWFHILPVMKDEQVEKLRKILINEKQKLAEIDKKYSQKLKTAQEERINDWKGEEFKEKLVGIKQAELEAKQDEKAHEEALLNQLNLL